MLKRRTVVNRLRLFSQNLKVLFVMFIFKMFIAGSSLSAETVIITFRFAIVSFVIITMTSFIIVKIVVILLINIDVVFFTGYFQILYFIDIFDVYQAAA